jgi:hypothetical protein
MSLHRNDKGIIHTTSYKQLNFIVENISEQNGQRLDFYSKSFVGNIGGKFEKTVNNAWSYYYCLHKLMQR